MGGNRDGCNGGRQSGKLNNFTWNKKLTKYVKDGQHEKAM